MAYSKTTSYDVKSISIINGTMEEKSLGFSGAVNTLIHQADYLLSKVEQLRKEKEYEQKNQNLLKMQ